MFHTKAYLTCEYEQNLFFGCCRHILKMFDFWAHSLLRAILQESEAKLEMKNFKPSSIFVWRQVTWGINKNNHIWIGRCIIAMVTTLDHVDHADVDVLTKKFTLKK